MRFPLLLVLLLAPLAVTAQAPTTASADSPTTYAFPKKGEAPIVGQDELLRMFKTHGNRLLVVNFWATWCAPCVAELPHFVEVSREYSGKGVQFVGVSGDFSEAVQSDVIPFLKEKKIPYPNVVMDDTTIDPTEFIELVNPKWGMGALPATFLYNKEGKQVGAYFEPLTKEDLEAAIEKALAQSAK